MAKALTNPSFDYGTVSEDEASKLRYFEGELARSRKRVSDEVIEHGRILHKVQGVLANHHRGVFVEWLDSCGISTSTAYNAISAYVEFASFPFLENLEVSAMYALASCDPPARNAAKKLAKKGVKVTHSMAKKLIEEARSDLGKPGGDAPSSINKAPVSDGPASSETAAETPAEDELVEGFGLAESPTTPAVPAGSETGEDVSLATDAAQETAPETPRNGTDRMDAPGEDLARKNRTLAHSYRDKLARAICDYHEICPNRKERDRLVSLVQSVELWA